MCDPRAGTTDGVALTNAAAQNDVTATAAAQGNSPLPAGPPDELAYEPGMVPQPVLLPGGGTLYPGDYYSADPCG